MARVAALSGTAILDTSWLLELYRVPGYFKEATAAGVEPLASSFATTFLP